MSRYVLDVSALSVVANALSLPVKDALRVGLAAADKLNGNAAVLFDSAFSKIVSEEELLPFRALVGGDFVLFTEPRGEIRELLYAMKPDIVVWCASPHSDTSPLTGGSGARELEIAAMEDTIKQAISVGQEVVRQQFVMCSPDVSTIKLAKRLGADGCMFRVEGEHISDTLADGLNYTSKLRLSSGLLGGVELFDLDWDSDLMVISGNVWFKVLAAGIGWLGEME